MSNARTHERTRTRTHARTNARVHARMHARMDGRKQVETVIARLDRTLAGLLMQLHEDYKDIELTKKSELKLNVLSADVVIRDAEALSKRSFLSKDPGESVHLASLLSKRINIESALRITKDPSGTWRLMPRAEKVDVLDAGSIAAGRLDEIALLRMQLAESRYGTSASHVDGSSAPMPVAKRVRKGGKWRVCKVCRVCKLRFGEWKEGFWRPGSQRIGPHSLSLTHASTPPLRVL